MNSHKLATNSQEYYPQLQKILHDPLSSYHSIHVQYIKWKCEANLLDKMKLSQDDHNHQDLLFEASDMIDQD